MRRELYWAEERINKCNCTEWLLDLKTLNVTCDCDRKKPNNRWPHYREELRKQIEAEKNA